MKSNRSKRGSLYKRRTAVCQMLPVTQNDGRCRHRFASRTRVSSGPSRPLSDPTSTDSVAILFVLSSRASRSSVIGSLPDWQLCHWNQSTQRRHSNCTSQTENELTEATIYSHRSRLGHFVRWCDEQGIGNLNDLTGRQLHRYRLWRRDEGDLSLASEDSDGHAASLRPMVRAGGWS